MKRKRKTGNDATSPAFLYSHGVLAADIQKHGSHNAN